MTTPEIAIVAPVFDEAGAAPALAREIADVFAARPVEILFVDDCSRDDTRARLLSLRPELPQLRVLGHARNAGQSRALRTGVVAARAPVIVTLDGDGQNDPADAPRLVARLLADDALALVGGRRAQRRDSAGKRWGSRVANGVRRRLLQDGADDTGCGLKAFRRDAFLALPYFDHMHRYLPALMLREGFGVAFEDVGHRPRRSGRSKYTNLGRLSDAASDLAGVAWLMRRARSPGTISEA
ncbi:MAG: glycosyltransferase family 2 protein [Caulobacteraceae bacterium]|nr:glycosyltransferase family 2 protein [Caulobacter sp.]